MVGYSFQTSFLAPIATKAKRQTIRLPRKRHARPGEALQFFTGPRMRPRRVGAAVCLNVHEVRLDFAANVVSLDDAITIEGEDLVAVAIRDGFAPPERIKLNAWEYMGRWWKLTHPDQPVFRGVLIDWNDTFTPAVEVVSVTGDAAAALVVHRASPLEAQP